MGQTHPQSTVALRLFGFPWASRSRRHHLTCCESLPRPGFGSLLDREDCPPTSFSRSLRALLLFPPLLQPFGIAARPCGPPWRDSNPPCKMHGRVSSPWMKSALLALSLYQNQWHGDVFCEFCVLLKARGKLQCQPQAQTRCNAKKNVRFKKNYKTDLRDMRKRRITAQQGILGGSAVGCPLNGSEKAWPMEGHYRVSHSIFNSNKQYIIGFPVSSPSALIQR